MLAGSLQACPLHYSHTHTHTHTHTLTSTCVYVSLGVRCLPAVIEGGTGRGEGQALSELVPLTGHLPQLEQHGLQALGGRPLVLERRRGRGGGFARRTCRSQDVTGGKIPLSYILLGS